MKTLKVLLQEVVSGIKAWANSNFAQESNAVHKTGNETVNGDKYLTGYIRHTLTYDCIQSTAFDVRTDPEANRGRDIFRFWEGDRSSLGDYLGGMSYYQETDGSSRLQLICFGYPTTGNPSQQRINFHAYRDGTGSFYPVRNDVNLGTSTNQWKSVYAQTYYYNGTAWGLDKANHWSANQYIENSSTPKFVLKDNRNDRTYTETDVAGGVMRWECVDKDDAPLSRISTTYRADKAVQLQFSILNEDSSGTEFERTLRFVTSIDPSVLAVFYPEQTELTELGNSTHKWKTFNGVNPGALSFPKIVRAQSRTLDRTNWDYTGTNWNTLDTSAMTGWGYIHIEDCGATDFILIRLGATDSGRPTQSANPILNIDGKYHLYITFPIVQNTYVYALIKTSGTVTTSVVYPCQGTILSS